MTQEEKQLLLKDLCARLPYMDDLKVAIYIDRNGAINDFRPIFSFNIDILNIFMRNTEFIIKPYLRPMSSMTELERNEYRKVVDKDFAILEDSIDAPIAYKYSDGMIVRDKPLFNEIDWLNKKMFDYRGLISMGLAIEAPKNMYNNTKTK